MPVFVVDAGDALWTGAHIPEAKLAQQRIKADLILHALQVGGIDAMTPGDGDLVLGIAEYRAWVEKYQLPVVAANLRCGDTLAFEPARRVERGGVTLGIVGVIEPELAPEGCTATPAAEAVQAAIAGLGAVDTVVVLSHMDKDQDAELAERVPEVDLVVNGHGRVTNQPPKALPGAALQLGSGSRGRSVGVATVSLVPGVKGFRAGDAVKEAKEALERNASRLRSVDERLAKATGPQIERMQRQKDLYDKERSRLQAALETAQAQEKEPANALDNSLVMLDQRVPDQPATLALLDAAKAAITAMETSAAAQAPDEGPRSFVGAATCQGCHPGPYAQWVGTPHARAWDSLVADNRHMDLACWSCHATGAGQPGGPATPATVGTLMGVQCESCHGPGAEHVRDPAPHPLPAQVDVEKCVGCHDGVKDEGRFDAETYLPKVVHADAKAP